MTSMIPSVFHFVLNRNFLDCDEQNFSISHTQKFLLIILKAREIKDSTQKET